VKYFNFSTEIMVFRVTNLPGINFVPGGAAMWYNKKIWQKGYGVPGGPSRAGTAGRIRGENHQTDTTFYFREMDGW